MTGHSSFPHLNVFQSCSSPSWSENSSMYQLTSFSLVTQGKRISLWMQILKSLLRNQNSCVVSGHLIRMTVELQLKAPLASAFLFTFCFSALTFACLSLSLPLGQVLASITAVKSGVTALWMRQSTGSREDGGVCLEQSFAGGYCQPLG